MFACKEFDQTCILKYLRQTSECLRFIVSQMLVKCCMFAPEPCCFSVTAYKAYILNDHGTIKTSPCGSKVIYLGFVQKLWECGVGDSGEIKEGGCCLPELTQYHVGACACPADGAACRREPDGVDGSPNQVRLVVQRYPAALRWDSFAL